MTPDSALVEAENRLRDALYTYNLVVADMGEEGIKELTEAFHAIAREQSEVRP